MWGRDERPGEVGAESGEVGWALRELLGEHPLRGRRVERQAPGERKERQDA